MASDYSIRDIYMLCKKNAPDAGEISKSVSPRANLDCGRVSNPALAAIYLKIRQSTEKSS